MKLDFNKIVRFLVLPILMLPLVACQKSSVSQDHLKIRIPLPDAAGIYSLQTVELHTVTDLSAMTGTTAYFRTDGRLQVNTQKGTSYLPGHLPSAHFTQIDDTFYADDFLTLSMATAMYHFEKIKEFFDLIKANDGIGFPRPVMFNMDDSEVTDSGVTQKVDNAEYNGNFDIFILVPYRLNLIPLSMNGGVLAHEYSHNVFYNLIKKNHLDLSKMARSSIREWSAEVPPPTDAEKTVAILDLTSDEIRQMNFSMLRSLDEGIADYFGYEYSLRNGSFLLPSIPDAKYRTLSSDKVFAFSSLGQIQYLVMLLRAKKLSSSGLEHLWGSFIARSLFQIAQDQGREKTLSGVIKFEGRLIQWFSQNMEKKVLTMNDFVHLYFEDLNPSVSLANNLAATFRYQLSLLDFADKPKGGDK